ncbi:hypothetical protein [Streptomyces sp. YIM 98790]|uniref:hypothetical protein n=1 Tax=Streptomyces sp. YIM 98790 TaxID=2689077 RepID=UPI00140D214D|nr:hypothetical protein [Streptomyces sp. YIM 98790]
MSSRYRNTGRPGTARHGRGRRAARGGQLAGLVAAWLGSRARRRRPARGGRLRRLVPSLLAARGILRQVQRHRRRRRYR